MVMNFSPWPCFPSSGVIVPRLILLGYEEGEKIYWKCCARKKQKKKRIKKIAGKIYNEIVCGFHMPKALAAFQSLLEGPGLFKESESEDYGWVTRREFPASCPLNLFFQRSGITVLWDQILSECMFRTQLSPTCGNLCPMGIFFKLDFFRDHRPGLE